jgi:hypothetical protein
MGRSCSSARALVAALCAVVLLLTTNPAIQAQSAASTKVPRLVRFAGTAKDLNGNRNDRRCRHHLLSI